MNLTSIISHLYEPIFIKEIKLLKKHLQCKADSKSTQNMYPEGKGADNFNTLSVSFNFQSALSDYLSLSHTHRHTNTYKHTHAHKSILNKTLRN